MLKSLYYYTLMLFGIALARLVPVDSDADGCNEYVCGSVVSKCLLTQSCQCKLTDCYCCKDCIHCMGELYTECCSCLDMCPRRNATQSALAPKSQIGDFDGVPELFEILTADNSDEQWTTVRFSSHADIKVRYGVELPNTARQSAGQADDAIDRQAMQRKTQPAAKANANANNDNCTVIFLNDCTTNKKCTQFCESMGANSYRWFHDGCCECVGAQCFNYGINESRCSACPEDETDANGGANEAADNNDDDYDGNDDNVEKDNEMWDYGENEMDYN